jgi:hypothetical protein
MKLDMNDPLDREMARLLWFGGVLVVLWLGFLFYLHRTGGNVKTAVYSFAGAFVGSYIINRVLRRR